MELFHPLVLASFREGNCQFLPSDIQYGRFRVVISLGEGSIILDRSKISYRDHLRRINLRRKLPSLPSGFPLTAEVTSDDTVVITSPTLTVKLIRRGSNTRTQARVIVNDTYIIGFDRHMQVRVGNTFFSEVGEKEYMISVRRHRINIINGYRTRDNKIYFTIIGQRVATDNNIIEIDNLTYAIRLPNRHYGTRYRAVTTPDTVTFSPHLSYSREEIAFFFRSLTGIGALIRHLQESYDLFSRDIIPVGSRKSRLTVDRESDPPSIKTLHRLITSLIDQYRHLETAAEEERHHLLHQQHRLLTMMEPVLRTLSSQ